MPPHVVARQQLNSKWHESASGVLRIPVMRASQGTSHQQRRAHTWSDGYRPGESLITIQVVCHCCEIEQPHSGQKKNGAWSCLYTIRIFLKWPFLESRKRSHHAHKRGNVHGEEWASITLRRRSQIQCSYLHSHSDSQLRTCKTAHNLPS